MSTDDGPLYDVTHGCPLGLFIDPDDLHGTWACARPGTCKMRMRAPQRFVLLHVLAMDLIEAFGTGRIAV